MPIARKIVRRRLAVAAASGLMLPAALALPSLSPAAAQGGPRFGATSQILLDGRNFSLTPRQAGPLTALRESIPGRRPGVQDAALAAARAVADSLDSRYLFAVYALEIGKQRGDKALQAEALDIMIPSGIPPRTKLASFLDARGGIAFAQGDYAAAGALWRRLLALRPGDADVLANLAQVEEGRKDPQAAGALIRQAIAARTGKDKKAPELWYRQALSIANQSGVARDAADAGLALVQAYPSSANWRDALVVYRQVAAPAGAFEIDLLRLTRAVGGLAKPSEYQRLAQLLEHAGLPAEGKAVLAEGLSNHILDAGTSPTREILAELDRALAPKPGKPPARPAEAAAAGTSAADKAFSGGRYVESAALYRAALQAGGSDSARLDTRLGMALVAAGRGGEAETAFRAAAAADPAAGGGYPDLARFWLAWLGQQRPAPPPSA